MRIIIALAAGFGLAAAIWLTVETRRNRLVWDHFDVVKPGILYRSGQLNQDQLAAAIVRYGLKTIVNFQLPGEGVEAERAVAKAHGVDFMNLPMPGDGFGEEAQFREVLKACDDPDRRPVLVHCARGTCRTGAAVGLFRMERDGWRIEDVAWEMRRQSYRDGWLPGFVLQMVKNRPGMDLFEPKVAFDKFRPEDKPSDAAERERQAHDEKLVRELLEREERARQFATQGAFEPTKKSPTFARPDLESASKPEPKLDPPTEPKRVAGRKEAVDGR